MDHKWLKIDLHMHGPFSRKVDHERINAGMTASEFVSKLEAKDVDVFSVTDHMAFSSQFYEELECAIKGKDIRLLCGCELNVYIPKEDTENEEEGRYFQAGVYFPSETVDKKALEKTISGLYGNIDQRGIPAKKPSLVVIVGELMKLSCPFLIVPEANKARGINDIFKLLNTRAQDAENKNEGYRFYNGYDTTKAFGLESMKQWALSFYTESEQFRKLVEEMSEPDVEDFKKRLSAALRNPNLPLNAPENQIVKEIERYCQNWAYFRFSDWHCAEEYEPQFNNFIFGTLDYPFESVHAAMMDPFSRLVVSPIGTDAPTVNQEFIREISFKIGANKRTVTFEPGLNAIVGKRASGKSLLLSALLSLRVSGERGELSVDKYKSIVDTSSIEAKTFSGRDISRGTYNAIDFIEQNAIASIFDDPNNSDDAFKNYFPELPEISRAPFETLLGTLKSLKKYPTSYPGASAYLSFTNRVRGLLLEPIATLPETEYVSKYEDLTHALENLVNAARNTRLNFLRLEESIANVKLEAHIFKEKIARYNAVISTGNAMIRNVIQSEQNYSSIQTQAMNDKREILQTCHSAFETLRLFKTFKYQAENFVIDLPLPIAKTTGRFAFVTSYALDANRLRENLLYELTSPIKGASNKSAWDAVHLYLQNELTLKANKSNLYEDIEKNFWIGNIKIKHTFYRRDDGDFPPTVSAKEIEDQVGNGVTNITKSSLGQKSAAFLELKLSESHASIFLFDQPEDNIDNSYISEELVPLLKKKKKEKQFIFVTHNPSVAVYADAFTYIRAENNDKEGIAFENIYLEEANSPNEILQILDGGRASFTNRNRKYGDVIGEF